MGIDTLHLYQFQNQAHIDHTSINYVYIYIHTYTCVHKQVIIPLYIDDARSMFYCGYGQVKCEWRCAMWAASIHFILWGQPIPFSTGAYSETKFSHMSYVYWGRIACDHHLHVRGLNLTRTHTHIRLWLSCPTKEKKQPWPCVDWRGIEWWSTVACQRTVYPPWYATIST